MKKAEERNTPNEKVEPLNAKFHELTDEELTLVSGGEWIEVDDDHPPRY